MRNWLGGKGGGLIAFLLIAGLVVGGLGWATAAALRLEQEQLASRAEAENFGKLRLALWRLDSLVSPALAKENSRPYNHYSAVFAPSLVLQSNGYLCEAGSVLEPSPLLHEDLPEWMLLHFQTTESGWASPHVLSPQLEQCLNNPLVRTPLFNVRPEQSALLVELAGHITPKSLLSLVQQRGAQLTLTETALLPPGKALDNKDKDVANQPPPSQQSVDSEYQNRLGQRAQIIPQKQNFAPSDELSVALGNVKENGESWLSRSAKKSARGAQVSVTLGPMVPLWLTPADRQERLLIARLVQVGSNQVCQGILLDWSRLQELLSQEVVDLFPVARMLPVYEDPPPSLERTMTALPIQLDPGQLRASLPTPGWTPLRVGLALAWLAAGIALAAVGLGGWSLIDLSERRFRFVSAVTHELRTPLTTLRLYLDMLAGGMIKEEDRKAEYLQTLNAEADRLNRLVGNVLDFSRLENQRPRLARSRVALAEVLQQIRSNWECRCRQAGKDLVIENGAEAGRMIFTDVQLVQQIVGNLIDNACKYSRDSEDPRIWLRVRNGSPAHLILEVEDRGPGVPLRERRSIFRPFRRGKEADVTAGGVGLGLALAQRWSQLLGGRLSLAEASSGTGACFRLALATPP